MTKSFICPTCAVDFTYMDDAVFHFTGVHLPRILARPEEYTDTKALAIGDAIKLLVAGYITRWGGVLSEVK